MRAAMFITPDRFSIFGKREKLLVIIIAKFLQVLKLTCMLYDRRRFACMPRGASSVIFTLRCSTPIGKNDTAAALRNNLKPDLGSS